MLIYFNPLWSKQVDSVSVLCKDFGIRDLRWNHAVNLHGIGYVMKYLVISFWQKLSFSVDCEDVSEKRNIFSEDKASKVIF